MTHPIVSLQRNQKTQSLRIRSLLAATVVGVVTALLVGAGTASAADGSAYGSAGWISTYTLAAASTSNDIFAQSLRTATIGLGPTWLYASPASSQTQLVTITNRIRGCTSNLGPLYAYYCSDEGSSSASWYVAPGAWRSIDPGTLDVTVSAHQGTRSFAQLTVTWKTLSGVVLGQKVVNYRSAGDGYCLTTGCSYAGSGTYDWAYSF
jgi:hypothetical protein